MIEPAGEFRLYETWDGRTRVECRLAPCATGNKGAADFNVKKLEKAAKAPPQTKKQPKQKDK